jgi:hypothetical protein
VVRLADGFTWWLPNLCLPPGAEPVSSAQEQEVLSWKSCDAPPSSPAGEASEERCGSVGRQHCAPGQCPLVGHRIDEARACVGAAEPLSSCVAAGHYCPPQVLFGKDAQGARWSFPSGCVPPGFTLIDASEGKLGGLQFCTRPSMAPARCSELASNACGTDARCRAVRGIQYDPVRHCRWPGLAEVGCVDAMQGCSSVVTHASYAGEGMPSFQFPDSCIPSKFVVASLPNSAVDNWEVCPEALTR